MNIDKIMSSGEFPINAFSPVYDFLLRQINNKDELLREEEIGTLRQKISSLDKLGRDMIYVIIRIHSLRNTNSKILEIPYGGTKVNTKLDGNDMISDVNFDIRNFPPVLCRMLLLFSDLHHKKMSEAADDKRPPDPWTAF
jgi:hypothetical protein